MKLDFIKYFNYVALKRAFILFALLSIIYIIVDNELYLTNNYNSPELQIQFSNNHSVVWSYIGVNFSLLNVTYEIPCNDPATQIVILVMVPVYKRKLRYTIRSTWGQWLSSIYTEKLYLNNKHFNHSSIKKTSYHSNNTKLVFVTAATELSNEKRMENMKYLEEEQFIYNDIIYMPNVRDSYMNLTLKVLSGLNIMMGSCKQATYFVKTDTDVFLNIPNLVKLCAENMKNATKNPIIIGNDQINASVDRNPLSKWYIPKSYFPLSRYPDYVVGCGYIINRKSLKSIIKNSRYAKSLFVWEDVAVTGLYRSNNTKIISNKSIYYYSSTYYINSCEMKSILLAHRINELKMIELWNDLQFVDYKQLTVLQMIEIQENSYFDLCKNYYKISKEFEKIIKNYFIYKKKD